MRRVILSNFLVFLFYGLYSLCDAADAEKGRLIGNGQAISPDHMMETVKFLSSVEMKGRGLGTKELDRAAEYIAQKLKDAGMKPGGDSDGGYFQTWDDSKLNVRMKNIVGVIPGRRPEYDGQSVVVAAHYDHLGLGALGGLKENIGKTHPGADDNASGIAVLIELARALAVSLNPERSIVFIAFTGEESGKLGSQYYVKNEKRHPASKAVGMLNLDTVGRLGKKKLLVLGAGSAKEWAQIFRVAGAAAGVEVETVSEELDSSDQKSFQEAGVPAVQLFSGPHLDYHRPTDTAYKIDAEGLVKVASVAKAVIEHLAGREGPLTSTLKPGAATHAGHRKERKVSLGAIPDFAYQGKGVRLSGVAPGSPAEKAGLKEGDVIVGINQSEVKNLKGLSDALKAMKAGDKATVTFLRDGREAHVAVEMKER